MLKKIKLTLFTFFVLSLPYTAKADLIVINNTHFDSSSVINDGLCSRILGPVGITLHDSTNIIPQDIIDFSCMADKSNCKANVYMTNNCSGPVIASVILNTKNGIQKIENNNINNFLISGNGFSIEINGGPVA